MFACITRAKKSCIRQQALQRQTCSGAIVYGRGKRVGLHRYASDVQSAGWLIGQLPGEDCRVLAVPTPIQSVDSC